METAQNSDAGLDSDRILIVEDSDVDYELTSRALKNSRYAESIARRPYVSEAPDFLTKMFQAALTRRL